MTEPCPCCHGTGLATAPVDPVAERADWCHARGLWVSADGQEVRTAVRRRCSA